VLAQIRLKVTRRENVDSVLSENTQTLEVNVHGALLVLAMIVHPGEMLTLKHLLSGEERQVRVVRVEEKRTPPKEVAVEFTSPAPDFWHIAFPSAD
jgi:hypothetical protein